LVTETRLYAPKILAARDVYASMYADKFTPSKSEFKLPDAATGKIYAPQLVSLNVPKPEDKTKEFWKGFIKDAFARFVKK
jgi:hypothetical protein